MEGTGLGFLGRAGGSQSSVRDLPAQERLGAVGGVGPGRMQEVIAAMGEYLL